MVSPRRAPSFLSANGRLDITLQKEREKMTSEEIESGTAKVRTTLAAAGGRTRGRGRGYNAQARGAAVAHARAVMATGRSVRQVALAIGIHEATLKSWLGDVSARAAGGFAPVRVKSSEAAPSRALSLVLPDGARVDGLDIGSAAALLRALR